jgi:2-C-methyl-D-erythritol 4-phosphate cytidylyltransferase
MKKYAVVVAGGSGKRMGTDLPKQFMLLGGNAVLFYTLKAFLEAYDDMKIILVLPEEHISRGVQIIQKTEGGQRIEITAGGATRFESVQNGLDMVEYDSIVFVHDGVRCMVSKNLIERCYEQAVEKGSAIPAVAATDSIRIDEGSSHYIMDRNKVRIIQTPQTFHSKILLEAFGQKADPSFTDEASVVEAFGTPVHLIEGEYDNLKITRPIDLLIAEKLLDERSAFK